MYLGIDLGGTAAKIGAITEQGKQLVTMVQPTNIYDPNETIDAITILIRTICKKYPAYTLKGVGFGVPGILDTGKGQIHHASNLPGWNNYHLKEELEKRLSLPVSIENDANLAALGESWLGAGKYVSDFLMVTLGTGIGGALILNNKLHLLNNVSCEFGHMIIDQAGVQCRCGRTGCLETFFSTHGLLRLYRQEIDDGTASQLDIEAGGKIMPTDLAKAAGQNDPAAVNAFHKAGIVLGIAMGNVTNLIGIRLTIIGGGIANAWNHFYHAMFTSYQNTVFENSKGETRIVHSQLGADAGWIGGAALIRKIER
jgi:glucokinase